jgi:vacuolar-type H+-ATPase subunit F/Vma7
LTNWQRQYKGEKVLKISFVLDRATASCFRLAGVKGVYSVESADEAGQKIDELLKDPEMLAILVVDYLFNQIPDLAERTEKRTYPLITSIAGTKGPVPIRTDPLAELIRRKVGIEVRW